MQSSLFVTYRDMVHMYMSAHADVIGNLPPTLAIATIQHACHALTLSGLFPAITPDDETLAAAWIAERYNIK